MLQLMLLNHTTNNNILYNILSGRRTSSLRDPQSKMGRVRPMRDTGDSGRRDD